MTAATRLETNFETAVDELAGRSRRLAQVVESSSRRRDCREFRARILLLVLEFSCPRSGRPRRAWYVPGAAARLGPDGLRRAWKGYFGQEPRSLRSFRAHLGALEQALAIVRSPGDWMPHRPDPEHPERRPRYPDTIYPLEDDLEAVWWEQEGEELRLANPGARNNPTTWRKIFGDWRLKAARGSLDLVQVVAFAAPEGNPGARHKPAHPGKPQALGDVLAGFAAAAKPESSTPDPVLRTTPREAAETVVRALISLRGPHSLLLALEQAGAGLRGAARRKALEDLERLQGAAAMLAVALCRDDGTTRHRIRNRAGWLVRAFESASDEELRKAFTLARRKVIS